MKKVEKFFEDLYESYLHRKEAAGPVQNENEERMKEYEKNRTFL